MEDEIIDPLEAKTVRKFQQSHYDRITVKIQQVISNAGSRSELRVLRWRLNDIFEDFVRVNEIYVNGANLNAEDYSAAQEWQSALEKETQEWCRKIDRYIDDRTCRLSTRASSRSSVSGCSSREDATPRIPDLGNTFRPAFAITNVPVVTAQTSATKSTKTLTHVKPDKTTVRVSARCFEDVGTPAVNAAPVAPAVMTALVPACTISTEAPDPVLRPTCNTATDVVDSVASSSLRVSDVAATTVTVSCRNTVTSMSASTASAGEEKATVVHSVQVDVGTSASVTAPSASAVTLASVPASWVADEMCDLNSLDRRMPTTVCTTTSKDETKGFESAPIPKSSAAVKKAPVPKNPTFAEQEARVALSRNSVTTSVVSAHRARVPVPAKPEFAEQGARVALPSNAVTTSLVSVHGAVAGRHSSVDAGFRKGTRDRVIDDSPTLSVVPPLMVVAHGSPSSAACDSLPVAAVQENVLRSALAFAANTTVPVATQSSSVAKTAPPQEVPGLTEIHRANALSVELAEKSVGRSASPGPVVVAAPVVGVPSSAGTGALVTAPSIPAVTPASVSANGDSEMTLAPATVPSVKATAHEPVQGTPAETQSKVRISTRSARRETFESPSQVPDIAETSLDIPSRASAFDLFSWDPGGWKGRTAPAPVFADPGFVGTSALVTAPTVPAVISASVSANWDSASTPALFAVPPAVSGASKESVRPSPGAKSTVPIATSLLSVASSGSSQVLVEVMTKLPDCTSAKKTSGRASTSQAVNPVPVVTIPSLAETSAQVIAQSVLAMTSSVSEQGEVVTTPTQVISLALYVTGRERVSVAPAVGGSTVPVTLPLPSLVTNESSLQSSVPVKALQERFSDSPFQERSALLAVSLGSTVAPALVPTDPSSVETRARVTALPNPAVTPAFVPTIGEHRRMPASVAVTTVSARAAESIPRDASEGKCSYVSNVAPLSSADVYRPNSASPRFARTRALVTTLSAPVVPSAKVSANVEMRTEGGEEILAAAPGSTSFLRPTDRVSPPMTTTVSDLSAPALVLGVPVNDETWALVAARFGYAVTPASGSASRATGRTPATNHVETLAMVLGCRVCGRAGRYNASRQKAIRLGVKLAYIGTVCLFQENTETVEIFMAKPFPEMTNVGLLDSQSTSLGKLLSAMTKVSAHALAVCVEVAPVPSLALVSESLAHGHPDKVAYVREPVPPDIVGPDLVPVPPILGETR